MLLKQSDTKLPMDLPENDGVFMFIWEDKKDLPNIVWDKITPQHIGSALEILTMNLLITDMRNYEQLLKMVEGVKDSVMKDKAGT